MSAIGAKMVQARVSKELQTLSWQDLVDAVQNASAGEKANLLREIQQGRDLSVLFLIVKRSIEQRARVEVQDLLSRPTLPVALLEELFP